MGRQEARPGQWLLGPQRPRGSCAQGSHPSAVKHGHHTEAEFPSRGQQWASEMLFPAILSFAVDPLEHPKRHELETLCSWFLILWIMKANSGFQVREYFRLRAPQGWGAGEASPERRPPLPRRGARSRRACAPAPPRARPAACAPPTPPAWPPGRRRLGGRARPRRRRRPGSLGGARGPQVRPPR